ncbi:MAG TPA: hypothetical protein VGA56_16335 [Opitutaceae bacterium]
MISQTPDNVAGTCESGPSRLELTWVQWSLLAVFGGYLIWMSFVGLDAIALLDEPRLPRRWEIPQLLILHKILCAGAAIAAGVLFLLTARFEGVSEERARLERFATWQFVLFLALALDVRFEFGRLLGSDFRNAAYVAVILAEVGVLVAHRDLIRLRPYTLVTLTVAVAASSALAAVDSLRSEGNVGSMWVQEILRAVACVAWAFFAWGFLIRRSRIAVANPAGVGGRVMVFVNWLWFVLCGIVLAGAVVAIVHVLNDQERLRGLFDLLHLDLEWTVPAFFSSALMFATACLTAVHSVVSRETFGKRWRGRWIVLSAGFVYLAFDESVSVHEFIGGPLLRLFPFLEGIFTFVWVVVAIPVVVSLAFYFWPMMRDMPAVHRRRWIVAAAVYVGGAVGIESLSGVVVGATGERGLLYQMIVVVEEGMEMIALWLFLRELVLMLPAVPATGKARAKESD